MLDYNICSKCSFLMHQKYSKFYLCRKSRIRSNWHYTKKNFEKDGKVPIDCKYLLEYVVFKQKNKSLLENTISSDII